MILYGASLSPFVFKVLVAAAEKSMPIELRDVKLRDTDPTFREASPFGKMPGFRDGDFAISDSSAIIAYLEATKPEPALIPALPRPRARTVWFDEFADTILAETTLKIFFNRWVARVYGEPHDPGLADAAQAEALPPKFDYLEKVVPDAGGYIVGDAITLADIAIGAQFVTLAHLGAMPDEARWPRLVSYIDSILSRPTFTQFSVPDRSKFEEMSAQLA